MTDIANLSGRELRHIANLKEKIDSLQGELARILGGTASGSRKKTGMSASGRARIAAAQRARWAKFHAGKPSKTSSKTKRTLSRAARAKIASAARARWAKAKAAGKKSL